jgi:hypothetical protein
MWYLYLHHNELRGTVPTELGDLTVLATTYLHTNRLIGTMPIELGQLTKFRKIDICKWSFRRLLATGRCARIVGFLTSHLYLGSLLDWNDLTGTVPSELCEFAPLTSFSADCKTKLTGCTCAAQLIFKRVTQGDVQYRYVATICECGLVFLRYGGYAIVRPRYKMCRAEPCFCWLILPMLLIAFGLTVSGRTWY